MMNLGKQSYENQVNRFLKELWNSIARNTSVPLATEILLVTFSLKSCTLKNTHLLFNILLNTSAKLKDNVRALNV